MARITLIPAPEVFRYKDGIVIQGHFPSKAVLEIVKAEGPFKLTLFDPPYGDIVDEQWDKHDPKTLVRDFVEWSNVIAKHTLDGGAYYFWGGIGKPLYRPFFEFLANVEALTPWRMAMLITWSKRRAYGVQNNYLFTREECAFFIKGDPKKPLVFNVPYLEAKRGYPGYNPEYPAKSEHYRRTAVWSDITEIFRGKEHPTQKPSTLYQIPILAHTMPGDTVFDPMAGSGTTAIAARETGRRFLIVERDPTYCALIRKRLDPSQAILEH